MITEPTRIWQKEVSKPIPKGRKNQTIGNRQVLLIQALQAECKVSRFSRFKQFIGIK